MILWGLIPQPPSLKRETVTDPGFKGCGCSLPGVKFVRKNFKKEMLLAGFEPSPVASRVSYCRGLNKLSHNHFFCMDAHLNYNNICIIFSMYIYTKNFENQWVLEHPRLAYWVRP